MFPSPSTFEHQDCIHNGLQATPDLALDKYIFITVLFINLFTTHRIANFRWQDAAEAYLSESWKRNVMWYVKDDAKLGFLDTDKKYRLEHTLNATAVSRKLLAFQVCLSIFRLVDFSVADRKFY